jgi:hypothetical protein
MDDVEKPHNRVKLWAILLITWCLELYTAIIPILLVVAQKQEEEHGNTTNITTSTTPEIVYASTSYPRIIGSIFSQ